MSQFLEKNKDFEWIILRGPWHRVPLQYVGVQTCSSNHFDCFSLAPQHPESAVELEVLLKVIEANVSLQ